MPPQSLRSRYRRSMSSILRLSVRSISSVFRWRSRWRWQVWLSMQLWIRSLLRPHSVRHSPRRVLSSARFRRLSRSILNLSRSILARWCHIPITSMQHSTPQSFLMARSAISLRVYVALWSYLPTSESMPRVRVSLSVH